MSLKTGLASVLFVGLVCSLSMEDSSVWAVNQPESSLQTELPKHYLPFSQTRLLASSQSPESKLNSDHSFSYQVIPEARLKSLQSRSLSVVSEAIQQIEKDLEKDKSLQLSQGLDFKTAQ